MSEAINLGRRRVAAMVAMTAAASRFGLAVAGQRQVQLLAFDGATGWLNSEPLTPDRLRGKVVLVNFCTYTCINWLRSLPYVRAWADKYRDQGLVVVGVHSPEFGFEKDLGNVRQAVRALGLTYPVAVDSDHAIWDTFNNDYWPALCFIDAKGEVRHRQFGEGEYDRSEKMIQRLLADSGKGGSGGQLASVDARGIQAPADWKNLESPENYVGYDRTENFSSPGGAARDTRRIYVAPEHLDLNHWALAGEWTIGKQATVSGQANGRIAYRFHARDLHLVMGSAAGVASVPFRVLVDGKAPGDAHGLDVGLDGSGMVTRPRLYQLLRQQAPIVDRQFEIEFLSPGAEAFAFTFG